MSKDSFKISVIGRVKHGALMKALKRLGWTQRDAAKHLGMNQSRFGDLINLRRLSKLTRTQKEKLMEMTGESFDDLFPPDVYSKRKFKGSNRFEISMDISLNTSLSGESFKTLMAPDTELQNKEVLSALNESVSKLTERERYIIDCRSENMTHREIAEKLGVIRQTVMNCENSAHTKLRKMLIKALPDEDFFS